MRTSSSLLPAGLALALLSCSQPSHQVAPPPPLATPIPAPVDWPTYNGDANETRFGRLDSVNTTTIGRLGLDWSLDLDDQVSLEATPLAIDGVLYFTGSYAEVFAVDGTSGKLLWKYDPESWKHAPQRMAFMAVNRGVAYADGRIFLGAQDGRLIALDAKTGQVLWQTETLPPNTTNTITGAPRAFNGKVIIGNNGADYGGRGYVTAYDAATGAQVWRFYTTPGTPEQNKGDPAMELAAKTWEGPYWKTGTGGTVWDGITFDRELNRIYIGTANAGPYDPTIGSDGKGDKLYTASIIALDADTGKYIWHYQLNPRDAWDYDATQQITLADLTIQGEPHKVLMQAPKNGFFYVLDRTNGKLLSAEKDGKVTWADHIDLATGRPVEGKNIRYETGDTKVWPNNYGTHNWQSMSFNPSTGLVYIPTMQFGTHFTINKPATDTKPAFPFFLENYKADGDDGKGFLLAWDPVAQKARWKVPQDNFWNGGTLSTEGNLVFQGDAQGYFSAYDATNGTRLWQFNAGLGISAAPMTYSVGGKQYVSILVGYGGTVATISDLGDLGWKFGAQKRRLLTFALDGKATLPPSPAPDQTVHAVDDPSIKISKAEAKAGYPLYLANCFICHGVNLKSPGAMGPDLRESNIALREDTLWSVVHDGALQSSGMPKFDHLTQQQAHQIYEYIRAGAREVLAHQQAQGSNH